MIQTELFAPGDYVFSRRRVLSEHGDFLQGTHTGENVHDVGQTDTGLRYLKGLIRQSHEINEDDIEVIHRIIRLREQS